VTLAIGVLSTMFSVLITAHLIMELLIDSGTLKKIRMRHLLKAIHVDFVRYGKPAFIGSGLLVILGMAVTFYQGSNIFGVDFSGGDVVTSSTTSASTSARSARSPTPPKIGEINVTYESALGGGNEQLKIETPEGKSQVLLDALQKAYPTRA
jgi:SecD/SecF fusion protein